MKEKDYRNYIHRVWDLLEEKNFEEIETIYQNYPKDKHSVYDMLFISILSLILSKQETLFFYEPIFKILDTKNDKLIVEFLAKVSSSVCGTISVFAINDIKIAVPLLPRCEDLEYYLSIDRLILDHCRENIHHSTDPKTIRVYFCYLIQMFVFVVLLDPDLPNVYDKIVQLCDETLKKKECKPIFPYINYFLSYFEKFYESYKGYVDKIASEKGIEKPSITYKEISDFSSYWDFFVSLALFEGSDKEKDLVETNFEKSLEAMKQYIEIIESDTEDYPEEDYPDDFDEECSFSEDEIIDENFDINTVEYGKINYKMGYDMLYNIVHFDYSDDESNLKKARAALWLNNYRLAYSTYISILGNENGKKYLSTIVKDIADISVEKVFNENMPRYDGLHILAREFDKYSEVSLFVLLSKRVMSHFTKKMNEFDVTDLGDITSLMGRYVIGQKIDNRKFVVVFSEISKSYAQCEIYLKRKNLPPKNSQLILSKYSTILFKKLANALSKMSVSDTYDVDLEHVFDEFDFIFSDWMLNRLVFGHNMKYIDECLDKFVSFFEKLYSGEYNKNEMEQTKE